MKHLIKNKKNRASVANSIASNKFSYIIGSALLGTMLGAWTGGSIALIIEAANGSLYNH